MGQALTTMEAITLRHIIIMTTVLPFTWDQGITHGITGTGMAVTITATTVITITIAKRVVSEAKKENPDWTMVQSGF